MLVLAPLLGNNLSGSFAVRKPAVWSVGLGQVGMGCKLVPEMKYLTFIQTSNWSLSFLGLCPTMWQCNVYYCSLA